MHGFDIERNDFPKFALPSVELPEGIVFPVYNAAMQSHIDIAAGKNERRWARQVWDLARE